ncbi:MAG: pyridoxal phosphate-dependent aminotransferase family protein [Arcobacteraceae bacterium]|jgi:8-amino-7-oxononanoate synthase|nr:pyridoxal phosphate-dependent aminotransferase family protein [Arcobacteraceae bacterium]
MFYDKELQALHKAKRVRSRVIYDDSLVDLASNDYLGLSKNKKLLKRAYKSIKKELYHSPKASILVNGYSKIHQKFEDKLKELHRFEDAIVVGSGFLANIAMFESLARKKDLFLIDEEYHASGVLATRLSDARILFFRHNDISHLQELINNNGGYQRLIIAIEGVYSMSGAIANKRIFDIADKYNALLIVDEAHSSGILGANLLGVFEHYGINPKANHIKMGTLGKAYGSYGAYILASKEIIEFLQNRAKPIIYSTAPSLFDIALAYEALLYIQKRKAVLRKKIQKRVSFLNQAFGKHNKSMIFTIPCKSNQEALDIQANLLDQGFIVGAIRQPTVKAPILRIIPNCQISYKKLKEFIKLYFILVSKA